MPHGSQGGGQTKRVDASSGLFVNGLNRRALAQIVYPDSSTGGSVAWEKAQSAETRGGARWVPGQSPDNSFSEWNQTTLVPMNGE